MFVAILYSSIAVITYKDINLWDYVDGRHLVLRNPDEGEDRPLNGGLRGEMDDNSTA